MYLSLPYTHQNNRGPTVHSIIKYFVISSDSYALLILQVISKSSQSCVSIASEASATPDYMHSEKTTNYIEHAQPGHILPKSSRFVTNFTISHHFTLSGCIFAEGDDFGWELKSFD